MPAHTTLPARMRRRGDAISRTAFPAGVARFARRRPVAALAAWYLTVGWAIASVPLVADARGWELPFQPFAIAMTLFGGLLPAFAITGLLGGRPAVRALAARSVLARVAPRWYAVALLPVPLLATTLAVLALGAPDGGASAVLEALLLGFAAQTVLTLITVNLAEEVIWTGFVQPRLQETRTPVRAAVLTAVLFTLQHVPLFVMDGAAGLVVLPLFLLLAIPFRISAGWLAGASRSVLLVGLFHAAGNGMTGGAGFGGWSDGMLPRLFDGDLVRTLHLLSYAAVGLAVLGLTRRRRVRRATRARPATA